MNGDNRPNITHITGGNFTGANAIGPGSTANAGSVSAGGSELDTLRSAVAELARELGDREGTSRDLEAAKADLTELTEELDSSEPDAEKVKKRWTVLGPSLKALTAASSVATITGLIQDLF